MKSGRDYSSYNREYKQIDVCPWPLGFDPKYLKHLPNANDTFSTHYQRYFISVSDASIIGDQDSIEFVIPKTLTFKKETLKWQNRNFSYYCYVWRLDE